VSAVRARSSRLPAWWPLAALTLLAAALRLSTLDLQSFWYDEAFTPVHVLHPSFVATLRSVVHTENTPPLWYVIAWADARVLGTGEVALRLPSALAGIAVVPVAWEIGRELTGRRATAIATAAFVTVNPLLVWYAQEARAYGLFVLLSAVSMLCFLRALHEPTPRRMWAFALAGSLALLSHYFAVFLLVPMVIWLLFNPGRRRAALPAVAVLALVGVALLPLISAQGGHGTQWIGEWALSSRLEAIPQYYLTDYYGSALGHGIELLVALPIIVGVAFGLWRVLTPVEERGALIALAIAAGGILIPVVLAFVGVDYLAPRNLVGAMIPVTALIALIVVGERAGSAGVAFAVMIALAFAAITIDINLSPRLQRGNWRDLAHVLARPASSAQTAPAGWNPARPRSARAAPAQSRAIVTVELGSAPLEYYLPSLRYLPPGRSVTVSEVDEVGYAPLRPSAGQSPAPGFQPAGEVNVDGLIAYRFVSPIARTIAEARLRSHTITLTRSEVLVSHPGVPSTP
jgi:4-amino-4-deoxy-L-arabinose transferase-like glycosyltransferase